MWEQPSSLPKVNQSSGTPAPYCCWDKVHKDHYINWRQPHNPLGGLCEEGGPSLSPRVNNQGLLLLPSPPPPLY